MTSPFKVLNAVVCEHMVHGINNKYTLINTVAGDLLVEKFPAQIPFAFYLELLPSIDGDTDLNLQIIIEKKIIVEGIAKAEFEAGRPAIIALPDGLAKFEKPSTLRVKIWADGQKPVTVVTKHLRLTDRPLS